MIVSKAWACLAGYDELVIVETARVGRRTVALYVLDAREKADTNRHQRQLRELGVGLPREVYGDVGLS